MSFTPPPPPGFQPTPTTYQQLSNVQSQPNAFRRPRVWVPPVIMLDAFAAGYAIPWSLGTHPFVTFWRLIFPLIVVAAICGVAGFYSYRTVRGWQMWTWIAFAISLINVANLWLFPIILIPVFPMIVLAIGTIGLFIAALLGAESLKPIHYQVPQRSY